MTSIGETLREERQRRNLDIQEISRELKIPAKFLEAIEQEQFEKLPAAVFAKSFVRQYARVLGLHEDELASAVQRLLDPPPPATADRAPLISQGQNIQMDPMAEWEQVGDRRSWSSSLPALAMVVVVMLGCSGVYAWWQRNRHSVAAQEQISNPAPPAQSAASGAGQPAAGVPGAPATAQPNAPAGPPASPGVAGVQTVSTASQATQAASDRVAPPAQESPAQAAPPPAGSVAESAPPRAAGPVHVEITASDVVWVLAKADGKTAFTGTMEANQSRTVDADKIVIVRLGNAGAAQITLNGKPIGEVGPKGQPRTVQFTSGGFQIVAPPKPALLLDPLR